MPSARKRRKAASECESVQKEPQKAYPIIKHLCLCEIEKRTPHERVSANNICKKPLLCVAGKKRLLLLFGIDELIGGRFVQRRAVHTRHGIFAVNIEGPIALVDVIIGGDAVDLFDVQAVIALLTVQELVLN